MTRIQLWSRPRHAIVSTAKVLKLSRVLARGQQFDRANFGIAMTHARSIAAKVLVDGMDPFSFYLRFEAVSSSCCLIVLTSGHASPVVSRSDYLGLASELFIRSSSFSFYFNDKITIKMMRILESAESAGMINLMTHNNDIGPRNVRGKG